MAELSEVSPFNRAEYLPGSKVGVVASRMAYYYAKESDNSAIRRVRSSTRRRSLRLISGTVMNFWIFFS